MKRHRVHNAVAVTLVVLASLSIGLTAVATWMHQTVLVTDRFVSVVSDVTSEPEVIDSVSLKLGAQVVAAIQLEQRLQNLLPDRLDRLAQPLTDTVEERITGATADLLSSETFQQRWEQALTRLHSSFLNLLHGEAQFVEVRDGKLTVDAVGLAQAVVAKLRDDGVLPPESQIPDFATTPERAEFVARLETALDTRLPDDFGQVPVADAAAIERMSAVLGKFDAVVIGLGVLSLILAAVAVWFAHRRVAALIWVLIGTEVVIGLVVLAMLVLQGAIADSIATPESHVLLGSFVDRLAQSLITWLAVIAAVLALVAVPLAFLTRRTRNVAQTGETEVAS